MLFQLKALGGSECALNVQVNQLILDYLVLLGELRVGQQAQFDCLAIVLGELAEEVLSDTVLVFPYNTRNPRAPGRGASSLSNAFREALRFSRSSDASAHALLKRNPDAVSADSQCGGREV